MKVSNILPIILIVLIAFSSELFAQQVYSEKVMEYKKPFLIQDTPYAFGLDSGEFIMFQEGDDKLFRLGRYNQEFDKKWVKEIRFGAHESVPQVFLKNDSIVVFNFVKPTDTTCTGLSFKMYDAVTGEELFSDIKNLVQECSDNITPKISFSQDKSKFVVYNCLFEEDTLKKAIFQMYNIEESAPYKVVSIEKDLVDFEAANNIFLYNNGDLFFAYADIDNSRIRADFWQNKSETPVVMESKFSFGTAPQKIDHLLIHRQSVSSYLVTFSAMQEGDLIGFGMSGFNVILKYTMYSNIYDFDSTAISNLYTETYTTNDNQESKVPSNLKNFYLVDQYTNSKNDIVLVFERLQSPGIYHNWPSGDNMEWETKEEKREYFGEDMLMFCYSVAGDLKWQKVIQKTQYSQSNSLGLSYVPYIKNDIFSMLIYDSSDGGNFYVLKINTDDGDLCENTSLFEKTKYVFAKKYSCWLDDNTVLVCAVSNGLMNTKRTLLQIGLDK